MCITLSLLDHYNDITKQAQNRIILDLVDIENHFYMTT